MLRQQKVAGIVGLLCWRFWPVVAVPAVSVAAFALVSPSNFVVLGAGWCVGWFGAGLVLWWDRRHRP